MDMSTIYAIDKEMAIKFIIYLRIITRNISFSDGTKTETIQRGAGLKHEAIVRMIWLYLHDKNAFYNNIQLFISAGSLNDVIQMLSYDLQYNGWNEKVLDWGFMGKLILSGLENDNTTNLVRKYLPQIRTNSKCNNVSAEADNIIGKWIASLIFGKKEDDSGLTYRKYRKIKTSGTAHQWQQLISQGKHNLVNFNTVHGRALAKMVSGKYITNNGLTSAYEKWIESKPAVKYTGYVHELFEKMPTKPYQINTLNSQFKGLVETGKKNATTTTGLIVVRDTSGSMSGLAENTNMSCFHIGKALGLYFSEMLSEGYFANSWIEFNSNAKLNTWAGSTPYQKWVNDTSRYNPRNTNFTSVIELFVSIKKKGVKESDFPTGILCISDMEFDPVELNKTNVQEALDMLLRGGFSQEYVDNFKIVLWNLQTRHNARFETYGDVKNVYYFSGYDASTIAFLTGVEGKNADNGETKTPSTSAELFEAAMNQEILNLITV
jgi:hypothetical protein